MKDYVQKAKQTQVMSVICIMLQFMINIESSSNNKAVIYILFQELSRGNRSEFYSDISVLTETELATLLLYNVYIMSICYMQLGCQKYLCPKTFLILIYNFR